MGFNNHLAVWILYVAGQWAAVHAGLSNMSACMAGSMDANKHKPVNTPSLTHCIHMQSSFALWRRKQQSTRSLSLTKHAK